VGGGGVRRRLTLSDNPGKILGILELAANSGSHLPGNLGKSGILASSENSVM
jgi:hypothetical protein